MQHSRRDPQTIDMRVLLMGALFTIAGGLFLFRLFILQVVQHGVFMAKAKTQRSSIAQIIPTRGTIYVTDRGSAESRYAVGTNRDAQLLYVVPKEIDNPKRVARAFAPILERSEFDLLKKIDKLNDPYEVLQHDVAEAQKERIEKYAFKGVHFVQEPMRSYPEKNIMSHVLGFYGYVGDVRKGVYGIEGYFDALLSGRGGRKEVEYDVAGRPIVFVNEKEEAVVNGSDIVLTIDRSVERVVCEKVKAAVERHQAERGSALVLNPKTGAVLAMCSVPDFDPNTYNKVEDAGVYPNLAIFSPYEPGSIFKPMTMAAGIDLGLVKPEDTYTDEGFVRIGKFTIRNSDGKRHGVQTMIQVLDESLNTGAMYVAEKVGKELFKKYVLDFGFGKVRGIELKTEVAGDMSIVSKRGDIYLATASYGQGITTTLLQLASAYGVIANGGVLMQPYIVDRTIGPDGTEKVTRPRAERAVLQPATATLLSGMLVSVVENGHGKRAKVPGYYVAGKTGTAQIPKKDGPGYEEGATIGSFAGFLPVTDPQFVIVVRIDRPKDVQWAESSAAPLFGEIAQFLVQYYSVQPDDLRQ